MIRIASPSDYIRSDAEDEDDEDGQEDDDEALAAAVAAPGTSGARVARLQTQTKKEKGAGRRKSGAKNFNKKFKVCMPTRADMGLNLISF